MFWKFDANRPVYLQIKEQFRSAVLSGQYPPGSRIPSVRELAISAKVNPNTMQRAMAELEQEGLLVSGGTLGKFVTEEQSIIEAIRQKAVTDAIKSAAARFRELGLGMEEAAALLVQQEEV